MYIQLYIPPTTNYRQFLKNKFKDKKRPNLFGLNKKRLYIVLFNKALYEI